MKNILISIVSDLNIDMNEIYAAFDRNGYSIEVFEAPHHQIQVDSLPVILDYVRSKEIYSGGTGKLVVCSDIRSLLFSWYRCYNTLLDAFVYFLHPDENRSIYIPNEQYFLNSLANFDGIEQENLFGKIYVNLDLENYKVLSNFLLDKDRFKYFDGFQNFDFNYMNESTKFILNKTYQYNSFLYDFGAEANKDYIVHLTADKRQKKTDERLLAQSLIQRSYFTIYALLEIFERAFENKKDSTALIALLNELKLEENTRLKEEVYDKIVQYLRNANWEWKKKAYLYSYLAYIARGKDLVKEINQLLINDDQNLHIHYRILLNTLFYVSNGGLSIYPDIFHDREKIMKKMVEYYKEDIKPQRSNKYSKRLLLLASQLLDPKHSPTGLTLNFAKNLRVYYPEYEIMIVVEDCFCSQFEDTLIPNTYSSYKSIDCQSLHQTVLGDLGISVYYSNVGQSRKNRVRADLHTIYDFDPDAIIVMGNSYSLLHRLLKEDYPIVYRSIGDIISGEHVDVFLSLKDEEIVQEDLRQFSLEPPAHILKHNPGFNPVEPAKQVTREQYRLSDQAFVMVTVGNRLEAELTVPFINMVCQFLRDNADSCWLLVGASQIPMLLRDHMELIDSRKIQLLAYEKDLSSLYTICDVYLNPERRGGGISAVMAMAQRVPVLTLKGKLDVAGWLGQEHAFAILQEYNEELKKIYWDLEYRQAKQDLMEKIVRSYTAESSADQLVEYCRLAINLFNEKKARRHGSKQEQNSI